MKNDIIIITAHGPVAIAINPTGTFDLKGDEKSVQAVVEEVPALQPTDNETALMGDALARIATMNGNAPHWPCPLVSHEEMQDRTLLDRPLVAFQVRESEDDEWKTERVFIDDDQAKAWIEPQSYRYEDEAEDKTWRLYALPAERSLAEAAKLARQLANLHR